MTRNLHLSLLLVLRFQETETAVEFSYPLPILHQDVSQTEKVYSTWILDWKVSSKQYTSPVHTKDHDSCTLAPLHLHLGETDMPLEERQLWNEFVLRSRRRSGFLGPIRLRQIHILHRSCWYLLRFRLQRQIPIFPFDAPHEQQCHSQSQHFPAHQAVGPLARFLLPKRRRTTPESLPQDHGLESRGLVHRAGSEDYETWSSLATSEDMPAICSLIMRAELNTLSAIP